MHYYNENDKHAAAWLRELIRQKLIPFGYVDTRSICDVRATELVRYTQHHWFAGIGGWPLALKLAGWPEDKPVWTGSCPCQPFSAAGKGEGASDDRHLWPVLSRLIGECHPDVVIGEQVARAIGFNWLDGVSADLEAQGYAVGSAVLGAHSVGAPHIRQRLYWVAYAQRHAGESRRASNQSGESAATACAGSHDEPGRRGVSGGLEHPTSDGREQWRSESIGRSTSGGCGVGWMGDAESIGLLRRENDEDGGRRECASGCAGEVGWMGDTDRSTEERFGSKRVPLESQQEAGRSSNANPWSDYQLIGCADGKARRIESGTFPLAHGVPGRVGLLRGYGNAIVPQLAAEFVRAFVEATERS